MVERPSRAREAAVTNAQPGSDSIPWVNSIFEQPWWLDAVAPGRWAAAEVRRDDKVVARLPYAQRRRLGLTTIGQPPFTQTLGPWLAPRACKYAQQLETEKKLIGELIEMLPPFDFFRQSFSPMLTNWLPFYWAGFRRPFATPTASRICPTSIVSAANSRSTSAAGSARRSPSSRSTTTIRSRSCCGSTADLRPPGREIADSPELVRRLDAACAQRGARRILGAVDARGRIHAALFVVWDERNLYALINARDPELQALGANTLLYWEAIRLASQVSRVFDFEGSMLEPIDTSSAGSAAGRPPTSRSRVPGSRPSRRWRRGRLARRSAVSVLDVG